jgi:hypothetical protein
MLLLAFALSLIQLEAAPRPEVYAVRFAGEFEIADAVEARAQAANIVTVAIDHVGVPRGVTGICLVQGHVTGVVRASGVTPQGRVEVSIPCAARPARNGQRRIIMSDIREASFANLYLSDRGILLDFQPVAR